MQVADVEALAQRPGYSSQRQLRLDLELLVGLSVGWLTLFLNNRSKDFLDIWHKVRGG